MFPPALPTSSTHVRTSIVAASIKKSIISLEHGVSEARQISGEMFKSKDVNEVRTMSYALQHIYFLMTISDGRMIER